MIAQLSVREGGANPFEGRGFPASRPPEAGFLGLGKVVILRAPARPLEAAGGLLQRKPSMAFDFTPSDEQKMLVETVRQFMAEEIFPHEREVERKGEVSLELGKQIQKRAMAMGLYAANMPAEVGGGGLDFVSATLMDRELGKSTWGLVGWIGRPSEILNACRDDQREAYLFPVIRGERKEGFALTEPNAG